MKKSWKSYLGTLLAAVMFLALVVPVQTAKAAQSGVWSYTVSGGVATVTGNTTTTNYYGLCVPGTIDGYTVKSIGTSAFSGKTNVYGISIPDTVTTIGNGAFCNCTNISSATIPASVTSIGYGAFAGCSRLTSVRIEGNPTLSAGALGTNTKTVYAHGYASKVIAYCNNNSNINLVLLDPIPSVPVPVPETFTYTDSYGTWTYQRSNQAIIAYSGTATNVVVPKKVYYNNVAYDVNRLETQSIKNNSYMKTLTVDVPIVNSTALYQCHSLEYVTVQSHVTVLAPYCFYYCNALKQITIYGNATITPIAIAQSSVNIVRY